MHSILEDAATSLQVAGGLHHLRSSGEASARFVEDAREQLRVEGQGDGLDLSSLPLDVVAFGSYARQEASGESDFDYLVIAYGLCEPVSAARTVLRQADRLRQAPRERSDSLFQASGARPTEIAPPGRTGMFGRVVSAPDLVERIGLEQDTNQTQSIRMLLLEESESLLRPDLHGDLLRSIVGRYLADSEGAKPGPPRFLINDVIRYWRTLTVDYAAKRYEQLAPEWGLRYLKLIISRKLTYAGTLVSLLSCGGDRPASVEHLVEQFRMPALARLAQLHTMLAEPTARAALAETLEIADWFNGRLGESAFRDGMKAVVGKDSTDEAFVEAVNKARRLQSCLETIFFESELLRRPAMTYLSF